MRARVLLGCVKVPHRISLCPVRQIPAPPVHQILTLERCVLLQVLVSDAGLGGAVRALPGNIVHPLRRYPIPAAALVHGSRKMCRSDRACSWCRMGGFFSYLREICLLQNLQPVSADNQ